MAGIPLSDDYPVRRVPVVTYLLIAVNVGVYLLSPLSQMAVWYGAEPLARACAVDVYIMRWAAVPAELLSGRQLADPSQCAGADFHKVPALSAFTSMFLHGSALHLLSNMVYLFVFGPCVEDRLGRLRYLGFYLVSGIVACYCFALGQGAEASVPLVGASGAISGVLGGYLVVQFRSRVITLVFGVIPVRLPGWVLVATYFVLQYFLYVSLTLFPGADTQTAYAAHVYGFVAGVIGGLLIYRIRWRAGSRLSDVH
ncbi:rhomboid family intramembrane serine protease [Marinitenerispora sediminis]|uniref:Rhomboid family intramembrane serine protease n=1 Tax=Marinitenerispora sediminis TaxID=1931232 RepID=A0A368T7L3_9ACTN|nr:rhomboid family intramembrane serine protease [Marinitenerispora sediminis]RCV54144.1 rhomboid family intramembrane serine protease [Marinitenerispora sediminis]RCV56790.1 rhomboid family intramembrane serine protease [Marinitenerispora sediminis]RCV59637.1 rhomboid family intramembrane serine protease [Marinitenerispora sediminis]